MSVIFWRKVWKIIQFNSDMANNSPWNPPLRKHQKFCFWGNGYKSYLPVSVNSDRLSRWWWQGKYRLHSEEDHFFRSQVFFTSRDLVTPVPKCQTKAFLVLVITVQWTMSLCRGYGRYGALGEFNWHKLVVEATNISRTYMPRFGKASTTLQLWTLCVLTLISEICDSATKFRKGDRIVDRTARTDSPIVSHNGSDALPC